MVLPCLFPPFLFPHVFSSLGDDSLIRPLSLCWDFFPLQGKMASIFSFTFISPPPVLEPCRSFCLCWLLFLFYIRVSAVFYNTVFKVFWSSCESSQWSLFKGKAWGLFRRRNMTVFNFWSYTANLFLCSVCQDVFFIDLVRVLSYWFTVKYSTGVTLGPVEHDPICLKLIASASFHLIWY